MADPLNDPIHAYVEDGWMEARGTSLGADNGIGLSMALAVLESNDIVHGPMEVITTTNEEDGMSGASQLSKDFLVGRKVINLDSEDYDTITTGAAGACLQFHRIPMKRQPAPSGKHRWYRIRFEGGLGGHSGVDINKGRCSAVVAMWAILAAIYNEFDFDVASINLGEANASIASSADIILCVPSGEACDPPRASPVMLQNFSSTSSCRTVASPVSMSTIDEVRRLKSGDVRSTTRCRASSHRRPPKPPPDPTAFGAPPDALTTKVWPGTFSLIV
jgi:hypothetical protein